MRKVSGLFSTLCLWALVLLVVGCGSEPTPVAVAPTPVAAPAPAPAPAPDPAPAPVADKVDLTISMTDYSFDPKEIEVPLGAEVTITLYNSGDRSHDFNIIGTYGVESQIIDPGAKQVLTFKADQAGLFEFVCSLRGHKERGMVGTLAVK